MLAGYKGYLVADAHSVYDHLYSTGDVVEVACWAHARRYFFKALSSDPERAERGLALIKGLFRVERTGTRVQSVEGFRGADVKPLLARLRAPAR